jgi:3-oxoacyl-[acyl-carrier protein] reductase
MARPVALVTGVGRRTGIGFAIAAALADAGWDIGFCYWSTYDARYTTDAPNEPAAIEAALQERGARVAAVAIDLADPDAADRLLDASEAALGPASALVLSHTEGIDSDFFSTTVESFDRHYAVNVRANWQLIAGFARRLPGDDGRIVALTSDHVVGNLPYGATKGALDRIVLAAARELGPRGIRANVVNPGPVDTGWMDDATREWTTARQALGRLGTPDDVAGVVAFLLSAPGGWVTGKLLHADGGFSA